MDSLGENHTSEKSLTIQPLGHAWGDGVIAVSATCTSEGERSFKCAICGETRTEPVPKTAHALEAIAAVEPSCTEGGVASHWKCADCGALFADAQGEHPATGNDLAVAPLGHDYRGVATRPTCTDRGYTTWTCSRCGGSYRDSWVDALGHSPAAAVIEDEASATWDEAGGYDSVVYCRDCGAELLREHVIVPPISSDPAAVSAKQVADCVTAINAIGVVDTDENGDAPTAIVSAVQAARTAYDALTDAQKALVPNYVALQTAEKKLADDKAAAQALAEARVELEAAQEQAVADLAAAQERAAAELAAEKDASAAELASVKQKAAEEIAAASQQGAGGRLGVGALFVADKCAYQVSAVGSSSEAALVATWATGTLKVPATVSYEGATFRVTSIAAKALKGNGAVRKVVVGDNVAAVGASAFDGCAKLRSVTIGASVASIGKGAFKGCKKLKIVSVSSDKLGKKAFKAMLKGSKIKTVKLAGVAKKMKKSYKKWAGKKVKVK